MSEPTLEPEAPTHTTLAELLRKARPPETRRAVQAVLDSGLRTGAKIAEIQRIDEATERDYEQPPKPSGSVDEMKAKAQLWQPLRYSLGKLKMIIKLPHNPVSFFPFIFVQYRRIREFGKRSHVFSPVFLLPALRLDKNVPHFLAESLQAWATRLNELLVPAIENGWKILTKREYNMIIALRRLCSEIIGENFQVLNYRDRSLIDKLRNLETLFFVFHYRDNYPEMVADNITRTLLSDGEHDDEAEEAEILVKSILFQGFSLPSLYDLLLGMNMMKFRQLLTLSDVVATDLGEVFNGFHFACDPRIQVQIDEAAENLHKAVIRLETHLRYIRRVKNYLPSQEEGETGNPMIEGFYEFGDEALTGAYLRERDNVILFIPHCLQRLDAAFAPLLRGAVEIEGIGSTLIFDSQLFQNTLDRLQSLSYKIEQLSFNYRAFPHDKYLIIRREGKGMIPLELEMVALLREAQTEVSRLGKNLAIVLERAVQPTTPNEELRPVDALALKQGSIAIPYANERILTASYIGEHTVWESLQLLVSLCFLLVAYLYDEEIEDLAASETATKQKIDSQLHAFQRLADDAAYRELLTEVVGIEESVSSFQSTMQLPE